MKPVSLHQVANIRIAVECCVRFENKVLLQKRPDNVKNFPGYWTFPGGHVDYGENVLTAVIREIKEETGVSVGNENTKLKVSAINHHIDKDQIWLIYGFLAKLDNYVEPISTDEGECKWFDINEVLESKIIFPPIQHYLEFITSTNPGNLYMAAKFEKGNLIELQSQIIA